MTQLEELNAKLDALRLKWKGNVPQSYLEKTWWAFRCDKTLAERYKQQIALLTDPNKDKPLNPEETYSAAEMIFGKTT